VGIAEQHAVTFAAGLATQGLKPVAAIYSTFLQRAFDQVLHDVCLQKLPVKLCLDRAGLVGDDGPTHHGVFDLAYLREMPHMTIMAPKDENELRHMLKTALDYNDGPIALRYPRGSGVGVSLAEPLHNLPIGKAEVLREGKDICLWAIGSMVQTALKVADLLAAQGISAGVVNMRFAKPLDKELLLQHAAQYKQLATLEEGILTGGVGSGVLELLNGAGLLPQTRVYRFGLPDEFVPQGDKKLLFQDLGLAPEQIAETLAQAVAKGKQS
jgi:1-deoxy-D-xylulose-5-phosphate synthase